MSVKVVLPSWVNDRNVPTVRTFYLKLFDQLEQHGVNFDIVPDYERLSITSPTKIEKVIPGLEINGRYKRMNSYDKTISYHTHNSDNINVKISYLPEYFYFDRHGYAGWSELTQSEPSYDNIKNVDDTFYKIKSKIVNENKSKYTQPERGISEELPTPYIFLPTQVENDEVSKLAYVDIYRLLKKCGSEIPQSNYHLVIKRHPKCNSERISNLLSNISRHSQVHIVEGSIHDLIENAAGVVTVNSGVGFESLLHEKPVITFGKTDYHWVTTTFKKLESVTNVPNVIESNNMQNKEKIREFVVYFLDHFLVNVNNKKSFQRAFERVNMI